VLLAISTSGSSKTWFAPSRRPDSAKCASSLSPGERRRDRKLLAAKTSISRPHSQTARIQEVHLLPPLSVRRHRCERWEQNETAFPDGDAGHRSAVLVCAASFRPRRIPHPWGRDELIVAVDRRSPKSCSRPRSRSRVNGSGCSRRQGHVNHQLQLHGLLTGKSRQCK